MARDNTPEEENDYDLGINPQALGSTESRLIGLLLNLLKFREGLNLAKIRKIMPEHYNSENVDSDQKKIKRDLNELSNLGFSAFYDQNSLTYKIDQNQPETKIHFSQEELQAISRAIINQSREDYLPELKSLSQKIFAGNVHLYPVFSGDHSDSSAQLGGSPNSHDSEKEPWSPTQEGEEKVSEILETLMSAIKGKIGMEMVYERSFGIPKTKTIDPIQIIRKNSTDLYLYAYDRDIHEYRHYLIPCIQSVRKLNDEYYRNHDPRKKTPLIHSLLFQKAEEIEMKVILLREREESELIFRNFLDPLPYSYDPTRGEFSFSTTNPSAIFPILLKLGDSITEIQPYSVKLSYMQFLEEMESTIQSL